MTFRFESSSFRLDTKANQDIARLAAYLNQPENRGKNVALLGFADSRGDFQRNLGLAQARADTVRRGLLAALGSKEQAKRIVAKGYSELAPVACNDSLEGQEFNRRVEVWLYLRGAPSRCVFRRAIASGLRLLGRGKRTERGSQYALHEVRKNCNETVFCRSPSSELIDFRLGAFGQTRRCGLNVTSAV